MYKILRVLGIFGMIFGIYRGFAEAVPLEDLAIVILIALTMYAIGGEMKAKKEKKMRIELPIDELKGGILIREALKI